MVGLDREIIVTAKISQSTVSCLKAFVAHVCCACLVLVCTGLNSVQMSAVDKTSSQGLPVTLRKSHTINVVILKQVNGILSCKRMSKCRYYIRSKVELRDKYVFCLALCEFGKNNCFISSPVLCAYIFALTMIYRSRLLPCTFV